MDEAMERGARGGTDHRPLRANGIPYQEIPFRNLLAAVYLAPLIVLQILANSQATGGESVDRMTRYQWFESVSLQRRVHTNQIHPDRSRKQFIANAAPLAFQSHEEPKVRRLSAAGR
jgi:hypothetical protein